MRSESFEFGGENGQRLSGRLDLPDSPVRAHALFAHCFTCTKNGHAAVRIARALTALGFGVLRFDFTGLGQSEGDFADSTFGGNVQDLAAAARAMLAAGREPSLLIGHSLGGAAVLAAAGDLPSVKAVATIAAPFDVAHVTRLFGERLGILLEQGEAEVHLGGRPFRMRRSFVDELRSHDQGQRIAGLRRALLVLHAPLDDIVDVVNATSIFQAARHPKSFVSLDDADHLLTRAADAEYAAGVIAAWAARYLRQMPMRSATDIGAVVVEDTGEGDFQVEVRAPGVSFLADEPADAGGLGSGPTPYDLLSAGLGACTAMTLRLYARRKGWPLQGVRVRVGHARDANESPADGFVRTIEVVGELSVEQRARLVEMAARCPVHRTLELGARVETVVAAQAAVPTDVESAGQHALDMDAGVWLVSREEGMSNETQGQALPVQRLEARTLMLDASTVIRRALPNRALRTVGAWCFLDHAGPVQFGPGQGMHVGPHPHIGLQTFTWMIEGEVMHRDSLGNQQIIRSGQVNLMTAGRGIAHSEDSVADGARLHLTQLWIALPDAERHRRPDFEHHGELPVLEQDRMRVSVLVGRALGASSPVSVYSPLVGLDIVALAPTRAVLPLERDFEHGALVLQGQARIAGEDLRPGTLLHLGRGRRDLDLQCEAQTQFMLLGGEPFDEKPLMWWNFVARTQEEIEQARDDWASASSRFESVPGAVTPPIAAPALPAARFKTRS